MQIFHRSVKNYQMSAQRKFRQIQRSLDDLGFMTNIYRIITNKRYEVQMNGTIVKVYKRRQNAKLFITKLYQKHAEHNN